MRDNQTHSAISRKTTDAYSNQAIDGGYEDLINSGNSCLLMIAYASLQYFASAQTGDGVPKLKIWMTGNVLDVLMKCGILENCVLAI